MSEETFDLNVPFTRESWNGRIKTCRGIEASLTNQQIEKFHENHMRKLFEIAPEQFEIKHYAAITVLERKAP